MAKITKAEQSERILFVQELLLAGHTRSAVHSAFTAKYGKTPERNIDRVISHATKQIQELNKINLETNLALIVSNLWDQFRLAKQVRDIGECRQLLMAIAKLKGLDINRHIIEDERDLEEVDEHTLDQMLAGTYVSPAKH